MGLGTLILIIYIIGFLITYYYCRNFKKKQGNWDWHYFYFAIIIAIFSWLSILIILSIELGEYISEKIPKPPKWL